MLRAPLSLLLMSTCAIPAFALTPGQRDIVLFHQHGGAPSAYVQSAITLQYGAFIAPISGTFTASGSWTAASGQTIPYAVAPSPSCVTGGMVYDLSGPSTGIGLSQMGTNASGCSGSPFNVTAMSGNTYPVHASAGATDHMAVSGPVASADNCKFVYSMWWRGSGYNTTLNPMANGGSDIVSAGVNYTNGSSENQKGIDITFDNAGDGASLRLNISNNLVLASNNVNTLQQTINQPANYFVFGGWNNIVWTANVCTTNQQYMEIAINGVPVPNIYLSGATSTVQPFTNTWSNGYGVNFNQPAGGFSLNVPAGGDSTTATDEADVMLWTGVDIHGSAGIAQADVNNFGAKANVSTAVTNAATLMQRAISGSSTSGSGSTETETLTFSSQSPTFTAGAPIVIAGALPATLAGNFTVSSALSTSVTYNCGLTSNCAAWTSKGRLGGASLSFSACPGGSSTAVLGQEIIDQSNANAFVGIAGTCSGGVLNFLSPYTMYGSGAQSNVASGDTLQFFNWVPKAPSVATAAYGGPNSGASDLLAGFNGPASSFATNHGASATPMSVQTFATTAGAGIADLTSSASYVSPSNIGGQPPHVPGRKWDCSIYYGASASIPNLQTCGNAIQPGDLLIAVFSAKWNTAANAVVCPTNWQPSGWTSWTNVATTTTEGQTLCVAYYAVQASDVGAITFAPVTPSLGANSTTGSSVSVLDYGNVKIGASPDGSLASTPVYASNSSQTHMTAPGITGAAYSNDLVVGIFQMPFPAQAASVPFTCPATLPKKRVDFSFMNNNNSPEILICDSGAAGMAPPVSGAYATMGGTSASYYSTGVLLPLAAN